MHWGSELQESMHEYPLNFEKNKNVREFTSEYRNQKKILTNTGYIDNPILVPFFFFFHD